MADFARETSAVGQYRFASGQARARGIQQRAEALQRAYSLESESAQNGYIAMQNMEAMQQNKHSARAAARVQSGASGFLTDVGTQRANQLQVMTAWEQNIANANKSYVIEDENARNQANAFRHYGDRALAMAEIEADYYNALASSAKRGRWAYLVGNSLSLGGGLMMQYGGRGKSQN